RGLAGVDPDLLGHEVGADLGELAVKGLQGGADRLPLEEALESLLEDPGVVGPLPDERVAPGAVYVAGHGEGALLQQTLGEPGDEVPGGEAPGAAAVGRPVAVAVGSAGAIAGEVEGDESAEAGVGGHVVAGKVMLLRQPPLAVRLPRGGAGPIAAQERPLVAELAAIAVGERDAVAGGEEEARGLRQDLGEAGLARLFSQDRLDVPRRP